MTDETKRVLDRVNTIILDERRQRLKEAQNHCEDVRKWKRKGNTHIAEISERYAYYLDGEADRLETLRQRILTELEDNDVHD